MIESIILPIQGSLEILSFKAIRDFILPFLFVLFLGTMFRGERLSYHPNIEAGTSALQVTLSPHWSVLISTLVLWLVSVSPPWPQAISATHIAPSSP